RESVLQLCSAGVFFNKCEHFFCFCTFNCRQCELFHVCFLEAGNLFARLQYGRCAHGEFIQAKSEQQWNCFFVPCHFPAHTCPFSFFVSCIDQDRKSVV